MHFQKLILLEKNIHERGGIDPEGPVWRTVTVQMRGGSPGASGREGELGFSPPAWSRMTRFHVRGRGEEAGGRGPDD